MSITGNLQTLELAELLQWLAQGTKTGVLVIENGKLEKKIYFDSGKIIFSESNNPYEHLGSILIREGLIDESTLARAVKLQESTQILLGKVLVTLGSITENELHGILQRKTEESIYELFGWEQGGFRFVPDEAPEQAGVPLCLEVTNLVLEALRRLDESRHTGQPLVEDHSGSYSLEIEEVLNTELLKNSNDDDVGGEQAELSELSDLPVIAEELVDATDQPDLNKQTYYQSKASRSTNKTPLLAAAAAVLLIVVGAASYFMFMRPDPADGATEYSDLKTPLASPGFAPSIVDAIEEGIDPSLDTVNPDQEEDPLAALEAPAVEPEQNDDAIRTQYEAELASLRTELAAAKRAAKPKPAVITKSQEPPVAGPVEANGVDNEKAASPEGAVEVAEVVTETTDSAGGDEPPSLSGSLQTLSSFDTKTGSELAEELVELQPELFAEPDSVEEPTPPETVTETVAEGDLVKPGPTVTPPVMLTRPRPAYPQSALRLRKEAVVTVRILIDESGKVEQTERVGPKAGLGFDQAAISAARVTTWRPATKDGVKVSMWAELKIQFKP